MSDVDQPIESPPEGATCAEHPERDALVTCPRCGSYCCIACWHGAVRHCHACVLRDPGPPVPWEDRERGIAARFFATLGDAFRPTRSAPGFVRSHWRPALWFAVLTFVPTALVAGIIPFTYLLGFAGREIHLLGTPTQGDIAIDVARAAGIGLLFATVKLVCLLAPYHSLARAYGSRGNVHAGVSLLLYRAWLIPFSELILSLLMWASPVGVGPNAEAVFMAASLIPIIVLMSSMLASARIASGVGPVAALVVVLVPFAAMMALTHIGAQTFHEWLPSPDELRRALETRPS